MPNIHHNKTNTSSVIKIRVNVNCRTPMVCAMQLTRALPLEPKVPQRKLEIVSTKLSEFFQTTTYYTYNKHIVGPARSSS